MFISKIRKARCIMANYTGKKCISCGNLFSEGDDIVVCPDCGTPYHRDCYQKEGACINTALHESGISWGESAQSSEETIRCIRCGYESASDKIFCEKCGTPLIKGQETEERPFNGYNQSKEDAQGESGATFNPFGGGASGTDNTNEQQTQNQFAPFPTPMVFDRNSEIDGIKLDDYAKYVKTNPLPFLSNFVRFGKFGRKVSLNIPAFLFPNVYFFFRKMTLIGIVMLVFNAFFDIPMMIELLQSGRAGYTIDLGIDTTGKVFQALSGAAWYLSFLVQFLAGFAANYIYYKKARKTILRFRADTSLTEEQVSEGISKAGGTSWGAVFLAFACYSAVLIGAIFILSKFILK